MNQITSNIWIGDCQDTNNESEIRKKDINAIFNVAKDLNDPWYEGILSCKVGLNDSEQNSISDISIAIELLANLIKDGRIVLIHCHVGNSRSPAIVAGYFARYLFTIGDKTYRLNNGLEKIKVMRPCNPYLGLLDVVKEAI